MAKKLLFVCTGNICRSPLAEIIARAYAEERGRDVEVASASVRETCEPFAEVMMLWRFHQRRALVIA